jgi:hypothetical protein
MEWEGEYGCRLVVGGEKAGQGVRVGELGLGGVEEKGWDRRRWMPKGVRGVLALSLGSGMGTKAGGIVAGEGTKKEKKIEEGEDNAAVEAGEEGLQEGEEMGPGVSQLAQGFFRRVVSEGQKGLFGQY